MSIILDRQNELIEDIFGNGLEFYILIGLYNTDLSEELRIDELEWDTFQHVMDIPLHEVRPEEHEGHPYFYQIFISRATWGTHQHDELLVRLANDEVRATFICPKKNRIINPYDGGVDIILENEPTMEAYKQRYSKWLSEREDGM